MKTQTLTTAVIETWPDCTAPELAELARGELPTLPVWKAANMFQRHKLQGLMEMGWIYEADKRKCRITRFPMATYRATKHGSERIRQITHAGGHTSA
jgi:hypothetical protein